MLNTLAAIATIMTLFFYIFIEWPKIQKRWKETYPTLERLLMVVSIIFGVLAIIPLALSIFIKGRFLEFYLSAGFTLFGLSMLIGYWIENKTFAYRRESHMSSIWLIIVIMFIVGVAGLLFYGFGL
jgi:FtsH-binding integral membrane protein